MCMIVLRSVVLPPSRMSFLFVFTQWIHQNGRNASKKLNPYIPIQVRIAIVHRQTNRSRGQAWVEWKRHSILSKRLGCHPPCKSCARNRKQTSSNYACTGPWHNRRVPNKRMLKRKPRHSTLHVVGDHLVPRTLPWQLSLARRSLVRRRKKRVCVREDAASEQSKEDWFHVLLCHYAFKNNA